MSAPLNAWSAYRPFPKTATIDARLFGLIGEIVSAQVNPLHHTAQSGLTTQARIGAVPHSIVRKSRQSTSVHV